MANRSLLKGPSSDFPGSAAKKFRTVSAWLRDYITAIKNGQMHPFTPIERKVREATRNEPWGPTGSALNELAEASFSSNDCEIILAVVQFRLGYPPEKWRNVYKALVLLEFLIQRGSDLCLQIVDQERISAKLLDLNSFTYTSPEGQDQGVNVRYRAKAIRDLLGDKERLSAEREMYRKKKKAYQGYSRNEMSTISAFSDDQALPSPHTDRSLSLRRSLSESGLTPKAQDEASSSGGAQLRNAGETKGVSQEDNARNQVELKRLLNLPHNRYCADCTNGGAACRASWASINNGTFICLKCAGIHRGLGVHISKVRSCTLDTWLPEQVAFMAETGNHKANAFLEAKLDLANKPTYDTPEVATFIQKKYAARVFAGEGVWPPSVSPLNSARSMKRASDDGCNSIEIDPAQTAASNSQRKEPRLPGRRSRQSSKVPNVPRPVTRMVSVPLPSTSLPASAPTIQEPAEPDLMSFDPPEHPSYSAPAGTLGSNGLRTGGEELGFSDPMLAELSKIEIPYDHEISQATYSLPNFGESGHQGSAASEAPHSTYNPHAVPPLAMQHVRQSSLPQWRALRSQSTASSAILTTGAMIFPDLPAENETAQPRSSRVSYDFTHDTQLPAIEEQGAELGFQEESVQDWGTQSASRPTQTSARSHCLRLPRKSEVDYDAISTASTPVVTPRLTALLGPGPQPSWRRNHAEAGLTYNPVNMLSSFKPASYNPQAGRPLSSLKETAQQLSAPQGGGNALDELVLHALADIPEFKNQRSPKVESRPMSLMQQRMQPNQRLVA